MTTLAERRARLFSVHVCNAWCRGEVHALRVVTGLNETAEQLTQVAAAEFGAVVIEAREAPEAPPMRGHRSYGVALHNVDPVQNDGPTWLVIARFPALPP